MHNSDQLEIIDFGHGLDRNLKHYINPVKNNWNQINDLSYLKCKHRKDFLCLENLMKIISNLATYIPNVNSDAKIFYFFRLPLWCVDQL